jgi:hypothetical protein
MAGQTSKKGGFAAISGWNDRKKRHNYPRCVGALPHNPSIKDPEGVVKELFCVAFLSAVGSRGTNRAGEEGTLVAFRATEVTVHTQEGQTASGNWLPRPRLATRAPSVTKFTKM